MMEAMRAESRRSEAEALGNDESWTEAPSRRLLEGEHGPGPALPSMQSASRLKTTEEVPTAESMRM